MSTAFNTEIQAMLDDCHEQFAATCSIKINTLGAMDTSTGVRARTPVTYTVTAIRTERPTDPGGGGGAMVQEQRYGIRASQLTLGEVPKIGDQVVDGSETLEVCSVETLANRLAYVLTCRRIRKS